jgi:hypothetical protein
MKSALVIVSHYNAWPTDQLIALLDQIQEIPSGHPFRCVIVVNQAVDRLLELPDRHSGLEIYYRENTGYNIGAWDYGWRTAAPADYYLFLQEECQIASPDWLGAFVRKLSRPKIGLVGEQMAWPGQSWKRTEYFHIGKKFAGPPGEPPIGHIDGVKRFVKAQGIPLGKTGEHLQSFILATRREVLEAIDGFMIGHCKGDAIACEIAISLSVAAQGMKIKQIGTHPFRYIRHPQWLDNDYGSFAPLFQFVDRFVPLPMTRVARNALFRLRPIVTGRPNPWEIPEEATKGGTPASTPTPETSPK